MFSRHGLAAALRTLLAASLIVAPLTSLEARPAVSSSAPAAASAQMLVAAANPHAVDAGLAVLRRGGTAIDAAVAVQAMLGLVEPQSSGIGGGAFMTWYDAATHRVSVFDGRETAPATAKADMFLDARGRPIPRSDAMLGGRATGVPGAVAMLKLAHDAGGKLPWNSLFDDTIRLAAAGFAISPRLEAHIRGGFPQASAPDVRRYFTRSDGSLMGTGDTLRNPAYAAFLRRLADQGPAALYAGETAARIVARVNEGTMPSGMTMADLAGYRAIRRDPLCRPVRAIILCVPPPPASGVGLLELMGLLGRTGIASRGPSEAKAWLDFIEASRLMYADRDLYVGDPAFVTVPVDGLLADRYLDERAKLIGATATPGAPAAGMPEGVVVAGIDTTLEPGGTSHFVIVDSYGNVVSMTTTIESFFGSGRMVDGFFLNNQMTDFAFDPRDSRGRPVANAVAPGKRPRSSMSPAVLLDRDGRFVAAIGSPGGNSILAYVGKTLTGMLDWKMTMQDAVDLPNIVARGTTADVETKRLDPAIAARLAGFGVKLRDATGEDSGLQGVERRGNGLRGAADPRREGVVRGP